MAVDKTADAVDALHKTMVMLRQELAKKNQKIKYLEARLNNDLEVIQTTTSKIEYVENEESEDRKSLKDKFKRNDEKRSVFSSLLLHNDQAAVALLDEHIKSS